MGLSIEPQAGATPLTNINTLTASQVIAGSATLAAVNNAVIVPTVFFKSYSGAMMSLSGTHAGMNLAFEATTNEGGTYRPWPAWHMTQGLWVSSFVMPTNGAAAFWMPSNGATNLKMRCTAITSGSAAGAGVAMHAPASIGTGIVDKDDWVGFVTEQVPGNNATIMVNMATTASSFLNVRATTGAAASYTIPAAKRLCIHSYAGNYLAGAGGGRCLVTLRSLMTGATTIFGDVLGQWDFGPTAGGTAPDERWSGLASALTEPIDIWSPTGTASIGISALGSAGTTGKLTFSLFGYLLG